MLDYLFDIQLNKIDTGSINCSGTKPKPLFFAFFSHVVHFIPCIKNLTELIVYTSVLLCGLCFRVNMVLIINLYMHSAMLVLMGIAFC